MRFRLNPSVIVRAEEKAIMMFQERIADTMLITLDGARLLVEHFDSGKVIPKEFLLPLLTKGYLVPSQEKTSSQRNLKLFSELIKIAEKRRAPLNALFTPETIHFSLTNSCDQNCIGCFYSKDEIEEEKFLKLETYKKIAQKSKERKVFQFALGGGEPLLHNDLLEMCHIAADRNIIPNITTNGNLFDSRLAKELSQINFGQIQFSLNGSDETTNKKTRPNYKQTMEAIALAKEHKLRWGINYLVTRSNLQDVPKIIDLADKLGAFTLNFLRVKPPIVEGSKWVAQESLSAEEHFQLKTVLFNKPSITKVTADASFSFLFSHLSSEEMYAKGIWGCAAAQRFCTISPDGHVLACSHMHHLWDIGNGDFEKAWTESKVFQRFRELNTTINGPCAQCAIKQTCKGCRAIAELLCEDFLASDPQCPKMA